MAPSAYRQRARRTAAVVDGAARDWLLERTQPHLQVGPMPAPLDIACYHRDSCALLYFAGATG